MKVLLVGNTIFEFALALLLLFRPEALGAGDSVALARVLAANAAGLGTLSLVSLKAAQFRPALIALAVFHSGAAFAQTINFSAGTGTVIPAIVIHATFAALFWVSVARTRMPSAATTA